MFVNFNILNQLGSPAINSNTFANRPAAGQTGRLFVSTDTFEIYRDNGTTWDLIGGPGSSTITGTGTATQVAYFTSSQAIGSSANLFWDNTSGFLGVGTAAPTTRIEAVKTDGIGIYANFTTNAGSGSSTTGIYSKNTTNSSGYAAVIEESTPNTTAGQYPLLIKHSLSSGTAGVGMGTGLQFQLPDDAGTFKTTQLTIETINAAAATYATRYRFNVQNNGSSTPVAYINATGLGIFTATPGAALDIHSTGIMAQLNSTSATANSLLAFQRSGSGLWRIGDVYNGGPNYFELYNTVLGINAMQVFAATNKTSWQATENYTSGVARGNYFDYNLTLNPANPLASPNAISAVGASLDLTLEGSITIPSGARSGLDAYNSIRFTTTGTLTHNQGTQIRAYSNLTAGWAFDGSATGTITHLAGLRALFPDNSGSAVNVTNNYALLLNDQTANTGTVTYTNRWGVYQEGASDTNYFNGTTLVGTTTNSGFKFDVLGAGRFFSSTAGNFTALTLTNSSNSSSARNVLTFNNDTGSVGLIDTFSSTWSTSGGDDAANGLRVLAPGSGGLSLRASTNTIRFYTGSSQRAIIDANGNFGLAVTPSAWGSLFKAYQNSAGSIWGYSTTDTGFVQNAYNNSTNWIYINSAHSTLYQQATGQHIWYNAPSGTAGNTITYTQAMTLNASGILLVNQTSVYTTAKVQVGGANSTTSANSIFAVQKTNEGYGMYFGVIGNGTSWIQSSDATETARYPLSLQPNGANVLIGTTTDAGYKLNVNGATLVSGGTSGSQSLFEDYVGGLRAAISVRNAADFAGGRGTGYAIQNGNGVDKAYFQIRSTSGSQTTYDLELQNLGAGSMTIDSTGKTLFSSSIKTAAPTTGTAADWKLGSRVAATVVVNTTEYIEVDIGGTLYKLATVT